MEVLKLHSMHVHTVTTKYIGYIMWTFMDWDQSDSVTL